jgi:hypothetical protein
MSKRCAVRLAVLSATLVGGGLTSSAFAVLPTVNKLDLASGQWSNISIGEPGVQVSGVRIAVGDVTGDGVDDLATKIEHSGDPHEYLESYAIRKGWDGTVKGNKFTAQLPDGTPFGRAVATFSDGTSRGVYVAAGEGEPGYIQSWSWGATNSGTGTIGMGAGRYFTPFGADYTGGVNVASGDVDGDGVPEIIAGARHTKTGHVTLLKRGGETARSFNAYTPDISPMPSTVVVASGDLDGDGRAEIVTSCFASSQGGGLPVVKVFSMDTVSDGAGGTTLSPFEMLSWSWGESRQGVVSPRDAASGLATGRVAVGDTDGDGRDEIILTGRNDAGPVCSIVKLSNAMGSRGLAVGSVFNVDLAPMLSLNGLPPGEPILRSMLLDVAYTPQTFSASTPGTLEAIGGTLVFSPVFVPEPSAIALATLAGAMLVARRRR